VAEVQSNSEKDARRRVPNEATLRPLRDLGGSAKSLAYAPPSVPSAERIDDTHVPNDGQLEPPALSLFLEVGNPDEALGEAFGRDASPDAPANGDTALGRDPGAANRPDGRGGAGPRRDMAIVGWEADPRLGREYAPHKVIRRVTDHMIDHLAQFDARIAGGPSLPDEWHASSVTTQADMAPFSRGDLDEARSRLRRLAQIWRIRLQQLPEDEMMWRWATSTRCARLRSARSSQATTPKCSGG
jgi:hypothetical protein